METAKVTVKGQVVIPSKIRKRLGIKKGTKVCFIEQADAVIIQPVTKDYYEKMAGILKGKGKPLTQLLLEERVRDRAREDRR